VGVAMLGSATPPPPSTVAVADVVAVSEAPDNHQN